MPKSLCALFVALALNVASAVAQPSGWGDLSGLLVSTLGGNDEGSFWLPDSADPASATRAIGLVYDNFEGGNGVFLTAGYYVRSGDGFRFEGRIDGLFGFDPRNQVWGPEHVDVTSTMLKPGEPRCCPTGEAVYRIDLATLTAERIGFR